MHYADDRATKIEVMPKSASVHGLMPQALVGDVALACHV